MKLRLIFSLVLCLVCGITYGDDIASQESNIFALMTRDVPGEGMASATIHYGGMLAVDETWSADMEHIVAGLVYVPSNVVLTIANGANVRFIGGGIVATGDCIARGVLFTDIGDGFASPQVSYNLFGNFAIDSETSIKFARNNGMAYASGESTMPMAINTRSNVAIPQEAVVHYGGMLAADETWSADREHIVAGLVYVPSNVVLTIANGAKVRFVGGGIAAQGDCIANGVMFTDIADGSIHVAPSYTLCGNITKDSNTTVKFSKIPIPFTEGASICEFALDTFNPEFRIAKDTENIVYSTWWSDGDSVRVTVTAPDGSSEKLVENSSPAYGRIEWKNSGAMGVYHFVHESGDECLEAKFAVVDGRVHADDILVDTVWTAGSTHIVTRRIAIRNGAELTIETGSVVKFISGAGLVVEEGQCLAEGVVFTSLYDDTVGGDTLADGDATAPEESSYLIVGFVRDDLATEYRYGVNSCSGVLGGEVEWRAEKTYLIDGTLTVATNGVLTIPAGTVVKFTEGSSLVVGNGGVCVAEGVIFTHVADDSVGGDTMGDGDATKPDYGKYTVDVAVLDDDATEYRYSAPITTSGTLNGNVVWRARQVYHVTGNLTLASGAKLTIAPGSVIKFDPNVSLTVNSGATLDAQGTRSSPIIFTSIKDDAHGGDTNGDGGATTPQAGDWRRIIVYGKANFDYCRLRYGSFSGGGNVNEGSDDLISVFSSGIVAFTNGQMENLAGYAVGLNAGNFHMTNSVIAEAFCAFRHWPYDPIVNCVIYNCNRLSNNNGQKFYNCIVVGVNEAWDWSSGNGNTYNNCVFWNRSDFGLQSLPGSATASNGNIWGDPKFVDPENGDFRISADSPCVDAGDGMAAPEKDWYGQTRQNVLSSLHAGRPDATGKYPDIGIHEVMPREVKSDIDLVVESVSAPRLLTVGQTATVSWTVKNLGSEMVSGAWVDKVELVCENGSVVEVGTVSISAMLIADGSRTFSETFTVPSAQVGAVRVRVTTNVNRDIFEGTLMANNSAESETVTLTMPELTLPDSGMTSFNVSAGGSVGYRLGSGFADGGLLVVHLESATAGGVKVWTGNGHVPTADIFYAAAIEVGGGDYLVRVPAGGDAYVAFANEGSGLAKVDVGTETGAFLLFDTGIVTAPNAGTASLTLYGNGFEDGMEVWIEKRGVRVGASEVVIFDQVKAVVSFDVTNLAPGAYEVHVKKGDAEVAASLLSLTETRIGPKWSCKLDIASSVRSSREYVGYLEYANKGDMPLDAPYVKITSGSGSFIRFGAADAWGDTLELMATSETYPASQLKPGETRRIPFRYKTIGSSLSIECSYTQDDNSAFPWDTNAAYMRPSWANDEMWAVALSTLKTNVGATWNDYLRRMRENLNFLAKNGVSTHQLGQAWQMEINEALGVDHAVSSLASSTDLARGGRGFGLALTRTYGSCLHQRLKCGVFGYGWASGYDVSCELQESGGKFVVQSSSGSSYSFTKLNGKWQPEDARDKTKMEETSTEYVLTARSEMVVRFSKANMRLKSVRDNMGNGIDFTYSGGKLTKVTHTDGQWISFTYSGGRIVSAADDQGRQTKYAYSGDMLTTVTAFNGLKVNYRYLPANSTPSSRALYQIVAPDGQTRDFTYDESGRVNTIARNGLHFMTEIVRGEHGSYSIIAPNGGITKVTVGAKGETLETVNGLGQKVTRTYTDETQLESVISPSGKRSKIEYDSDGQAVKTFDAAGAETSFAYTSDFGALKSVTDAKRHAIEYGYDKKGRSESVAYSDETQSRITYNDKGDVVRATNAKGVEIEYAYDDEGRKTSAVWPDGRTFAWEYDAKGNCTNASDSVTGAVTMEYDDKEQLTRITYPKGRGFTYEYDAYGRVTKRTMLGRAASPLAADIQRYTYDTFGRVSRMTDGDGNLYVANAYDPVTGDLVTQTYGNGTVVSNSYDILGRVVAITHRNAAGDVLDAFLYDYNADGQRIQLETSEGVEKYSYDMAGQLTGVTYPDDSNESFSYDAVGNRTSSGGSQFTATYTVNNLNQYTTILRDSASLREENFTYDLDGNLVLRTSADDGATCYYYDCEDRLVGVTNTTKGVAWSCVYDVFGNRVMVDDNGTVTEKLYVQGSLPSVVAEYDGDDNLSTRHILMGSTRLADIGTTGGLPVATRYYHADGLASTRILTDADGIVTATASYNAFGSIRSASGESVSDGWVGTLGVERDNATGLIFMRNRYYDPVAGRFTQRDPIGYTAGDVNWYRYCGNAPEDYYDPFGFSTQWCTPCFISAINTGIVSGMAVGAVLGAASVSAPALAVGLASGGTLALPAAGVVAIAAGYGAVQGAIWGAAFGAAFYISTTISTSTGGFNFGRGGGSGGGSKPPKRPFEEKIIKVFEETAEKVQKTFEEHIKEPILNGILKGG